MWGRCRRRVCRWGLGLVVPLWGTWWLEGSAQWVVWIEGTSALV